MKRLQPKPTPGDVRRMFKLRYGNGVNFMTPTPVRYGHSKHDPTLIFEISEGSSIYPEDWLIGVTVLDTENGCDPLFDISKVIDCRRKDTAKTMREAIAYAENLTRE